MKSIYLPITLALGLGLTLALLWAAGVQTAPATAEAPVAELRVCPDGPPDCDYNTVQAAVDQANPGDEIRVATGVYTGVNNYGGLAQVVYISKTVTVRGGYTTTNWSVSNPISYPTTLDAQGLGRVLYITGDIIPTVEGLRITGGDATGLGGTDLGRDAGGGVYVSAATATISNCVVYSNTASTADWGYGGGLYLWESAATLNGNTVQGNTASTADWGSGGGLVLLYSAAMLSGNTVQGNTASTADRGEGGGLVLSYSDAALSGNTVVSNTASTASTGYGGGLLLWKSDAALNSNTVQGNTASTGRGGFGGGLYLASSDATLSSNTVQSNTASTALGGYGGGLYLNNSAATLSGNTVQGNTASTADRGEGGGLVLSYSDAALSGNTVVSNTASTASTGYGGGLLLWKSAATLNGNTVVSNTATLSPTAIGYGGGLRVRGSSPFTLTNNLVAGNHANTQGSGLAFDGSSTDPTSGRLLHNTIADNRSSGQGVFVDEYTTLAFTNTIIAGHDSVGITVTAGSTATLEATLWYDNGSDTGGGGTIFTGTVNVYDDPAFVNPSTWDYHLTAASAAIDAGVDAGVLTDIDGDPRPFFSGYDIGADEHSIGVQLAPDRSGTANPGTVVTYTHTLTNTGNGPDTFTITHASSQNWTVTYDTPIALGAGQATTLLVSVTVPSDVVSGTVDSTVITATSQGDPGVFDTATDTTTVITVTTPTVTAVQPDSAPNDLDTMVVISGTGFTAGLSGTQVITPPMIYLDSTELADVIWVDTTTLSATVQWGLDPGVYTLTVVNPDGLLGTLPNTFTVTQGIGVWTTGGPYGGEIVQLVLNPVTPTTVYALAHNAGVFASFDAAGTWEQILLDDTPNLMVLDAEDPEVMYLGSACCLLRTKDGGSAWESVSPPGGDGSFYPATHPVSPGVIYVGSAHPIQPAPVGLFRSDDYGDTWVTLTVGLTDTLVMAIAFHPDDPDTMMVGTVDGNVFRSTDGGETWNWTARVSSHIERLYFNPFGAHEAWATTESPYGGYDLPYYLYKSEDPELATWTPITVAEGGGGVVWSLTFLSDTIWSAGAAGFTSTDGGASWSPVSAAGLLPGWREDTKEFAIDPSNPDVVYAGDVGLAVFKSSDGGAAWSKMNEGLAGIAPWELVVTPGDPDTVYAQSFALGVLKSNNGGRSWRWLGIGKGGSAHPLAVDPVTPTRVYMGDQGSGYVRLQISENAGDTWHEVTATLPVTWSGWKTDVLKVAPHPRISGTILAGARFLLSYALPDAGTERGAIYASDDYGEHWEYVGPTQPISGVVELAFDAVDPNLVYAATYGTGLWKSADGGTNWQPVTSFPGVPWLWSVAAHPDVPNLVYVKCDRAPITDPTLFVSQDAGETWEALPPCDDCGHLLFVPPERGNPPYTLYAGPGLPYGLYRSTDGGYTWEQVEEVPATDIYSLAAGSDGERVVVYVGISGGVVSPEPQAAGTSDAIPGRGGLKPAGVYRYTTLPTRWVYLPLVFKAYTQ